MPRSFRFYQNLSTTGAVAVTAFEINSDLFVAFANNLDGSGKMANNSPIYFLHNGTFNLSQSLSTLGAQFVEHFVIDRKHFLAFGIRDATATSTMNIHIYR